MSPPLPPTERPRRARGQGLWWLLGTAGVTALLFLAGRSAPPAGAAPVRPLVADEGDDDAPPRPAPGPREAEVREAVVAMTETAPLLDRESPHPLTQVPTNPPTNLSAFRFIEDHRRYDLRGWKQVGPDDGPHTSGVVMDRRLRAVKREAVDRLDVIGRTSGAGMVMRCVAPNPDAARVYASHARPTVRGRPMTEHRLSIDVSDVPVGGEFEVVLRTTYWNSLQAADEQWFGTLGTAGSKTLSLLVLFPDGKPFRGGCLRAGQRRGALNPYDGPQVVFSGPHGSWVFWEVPGPSNGHLYRLDWKW